MEENLFEQWWAAWTATTIMIYQLFQYQEVGSPFNARLHPYHASGVMSKDGDRFIEVVFGFKYVTSFDLLAHRLPPERNLSTIYINKAKPGARFARQWEKETLPDTIRFWQYEWISHRQRFIEQRGITTNKIEEDLLIDLL